jgi:hypothetical protein
VSTRLHRLGILRGPSGPPRGVGLIPQACWTQRRGAMLLTRLTRCNCKPRDDHLQVRTGRVGNPASTLASSRFSGRFRSMWLHRREFQHPPAWSRTRCRCQVALATVGCGYQVTQSSETRD